MDSFFESIGALSALAIKWSAVMFEFMERSHAKAGNFRKIMFNLQSKRNMTCCTAVRGYNQLLANVTKASQLWLDSGINDW